MSWLQNVHNSFVVSACPYLTVSNLNAPFSELVGTYTRIGRFQWVQVESKDQFRLSFDEFWTIVPKNGYQSLWRKREEDVPEANEAQAELNRTFKSFGLF